MKRWGWVAGLLVTHAAVAQVGSSARFLRVEEPELLRLQITDVEAGVEVQGDYETTKFKDTGQKYTENRLFVGPWLGLAANGSIYHSNLIRFHFDGAGTYGWQEETTGQNNNDSKQGQEWYGQFNGRIEFLANKPVNGGVFGGYGHSYREYDFFSRTTVDSFSYGAHLNASFDGWTLGTSYAHSDDHLDDNTEPNDTHQDVATFDAHNTRQSGDSQCNYTYSDYKNGDGGPQQHTINQTVTVSDNEQFGSHKQFQLQSGATYNHQDSDGDVSEQYTANTTLYAQHTDKLSSDYNFNFDRFTLDDFTSDNYVGRANLRHQLYESLSSLLTFQATDSEQSDQNNNGYTRTYGGGIGEVYTKKLTPEHVLRIDNSVFVEHVDQKGVGRVENERHTFPLPPQPEEFLLNQPDVIQSTIVITDVNNNQQYVAGIDYQIFQNGSRTGIRRITGGNIPQGATVLCDYEAVPTPPGQYESLSDWFGVRLSFWNNFWNVYGRVYYSDNNASSELRVPVTTSYTVGTEFDWHWARAGAEAIEYDSTDSSYRSLRLFQACFFNMDDSSSWGLDFSQAFTDYTDGNRNEQDYRFLSHYQRVIAHNLRFTCEAGAALTYGKDVEQTVVVARPELNYFIGRTTIQATYNYEYDLFLNNEEQLKHIFFLRVKRSF